MTTIKCDKCQYQWEYKGKSKYYCCCPRCRKNLKVDKHTTKKGGITIK